MARDAFGTIVSALNPPLVVVTAATARERAGCLVGFHAQSSIDPERYCVWLSKANHTYRVALHSTHVGVHFLTAADRSLAELFGGESGDTRDKFAGLEVIEGAGGVPLLGECPHRLVARRTALLDEGGDHVCLAAELVHAWSTGAFEPLRLSEVGRLAPGHANDERNEPPTERAAADPG